MLDSQTVTCESFAHMSVGTFVCALLLEKVKGQSLTTRTSPLRFGRKSPMMDFAV